jgi:hypothetical protein
LVIDVLAKKMANPSFRGAVSTQQNPGEARVGYLDAIHAADTGNYGPLIKFSRE